MPLIRSTALFRYGDSSMLKGRPATTVWIGFAPEPDGDGVALGTPETGDPDPEGGNTFEVGLVPDSPGDGGPGGTTDGGRLGKPLDDCPGGPFVEAGGC